MPTSLPVEITSPTSNASFELGVEVTFTGRLGSQVARVDLVADGKFPMGPAAHGTEDKWSLDRKFSASGARRIEAIAFDDDGNFLGMDFVDIFIKSPEVSNQRKAIVARATSQLGLQETPLGSNGGSQIAKYFEYCGHSQPNDWCFMFLNWVYGTAIGQEPPWGRSMAYVPTMVAWAKKSGKWILENDPHVDGFQKGEPKPGDLIIMGDEIQIATRQNYPHIELVSRVTPSVIYTIGGNVSPGVVGPRQHPRSGLGSDGRYIAGYVSVEK